MAGKIQCQVEPGFSSVSCVTHKVVLEVLISNRNQEALYFCSISYPNDG